MQYYFVNLSTLKDELFIEEYDHDVPDLSMKLMDGQPISEEIDLELYNPVPHKKKTDLLGVVEFFVVSKRLNNILARKEPDFLRFYEAALVSTVDGSREPYYLVNILNNIDAIDYTNSEIIFYEGTSVIDKVHALVLDEQSIDKRHIFRLANLDTEIVISEEVKQECEQNQITGIKYVPIEAFRKGNYSADFYF